MEEWFEQVFFIPGKTKPNSDGIILSCGIHGNETAPIEACNALLAAIRTNKVYPGRPLLLIFGNPRAMAIQRRYVDFNLNRLFGSTAPGGIEARRARELEQACQRFHRYCRQISWHLDLHSTIKPSCIERFALTPVMSEGAYRCHWQTSLYQAGFRGVVYQTQRANTFCQYTHDHFQADSFTLECGNLQSAESHSPSLLNWLVDMVSDPLSPSQPESTDTVEDTMQEFQVAEEIIRTSDRFRFLIDEQEPNFSRHGAGTQIYSDQDGSFSISEDRYSLFLNGRVEAGQRAGLLLKRLK